VRLLGNEHPALPLLLSISSPRRLLDHGSSGAGCAQIRMPPLRVIGGLELADDPAIWTLASQMVLRRPPVAL
jgi:hypothetical protein